MSKKKLSTEQDLDRVGGQAQESNEGETLPDFPVHRSGSKTICLPHTREDYPEVVSHVDSFRAWIDGCYKRHPELFPEAMPEGYRCHDFQEPSKKLGVQLRRIKLKATGEVFSLCPSFVMPYMVGYTKEVEPALFLKGFGVPYWALTHVFGRNDMYWYRLEVAFGRNSLVGSTVKKTERLPKDLVADEKHSSHQGNKVYVATTAGEDCLLGAEVCQGSDTQSLTQGYGVFAKEARNVDPAYAPDTVNLDGWDATRLAWNALFSPTTVILCFLHSFLKIRERCKKWGELYFEIGDWVWYAYQATSKRSFMQRVRRLREWAKNTLEEGVVLKKVLALCSKASLFAQAYEHSHVHRTSNLVDRLMRRQDRFLFNRQYFHRSLDAAQLAIRAWALLSNYRPYCPRTLHNSTDPKCAAERLNGFRYCDDWLENLRISTSMGGYRQ